MNQFCCNFAETKKVMISRKLRPNSDGSNGEFSTARMRTSENKENKLKRIKSSGECISLEKVKQILSSFILVVMDLTSKKTSCLSVFVAIRIGAKLTAEFIYHDRNPTLMSFVWYLNIVCHFTSLLSRLF